jgi:DNA-binding CsgD family transcriptional regulator
VLALDRGDVTLAGSLVADSLAIGEERGDGLVIARAVEVYAGLACQEGTVAAAKHALRLAGAAAALREERSVPRYWYEEDDLQRCLAGARAQLAPEAAASAWDAGRTLSIEEALVVAKDIHRTPRDRSASPGGLSAREAEVLRLVAAGKSNQQIADELVISLNTVVRHVSNIFNKIGAANRVEAASYATRHGLLPE